MEEKERYRFFETAIQDTEYQNTDVPQSLMDKTLCCIRLNEQDARIKELEEENQQLKQQLHDLPKKIVEEIRKEIEFPLYVHPDFDEFECLFDIDKLLDTILKKYGGEDV